jgi:hypothetical protein
MEKNFEIGQSNEVLAGGKVYDLHNLYDLSEVRIGRSRDVWISFEANAEHGQGQPRLVLTFAGVDYLEFSPRFGARPVRNVDEMGYKNPDDRQDEWLLTEQQATRADHLFLRLGGGDFIRVHSQRACLEVEGESTS